jgi:hypothetical protein
MEENDRIGKAWTDRSVYRPEKKIPPKLLRGSPMFLSGEAGNSLHFISLHFT